ncbi:hypothetical protein J7E55_03070 [Bacillus sp. ISL-53]|nr:hypothetical protein [Bacillus sp. ISL-53]
MQKKIISLIIITLAVFLLLFNMDNNRKTATEMKFNSEQEALEYAKQETPYIVDFIDETKSIDNEKIVIYKFKKDKEIGIGTGTLKWKDKKVIWIKNGNDIVISDNNETKTDISGEVETYSGKKYRLYAGIANSKNIKIETETDNNITPHIDDKSGIYYLLIPSLKK